MKKGFVDLQVNGWMGTDFAAEGLTVDRVKEITRELVARGTVAYCPTLITANPELYRVNLAVIAAAKRDPAVGPHILGIHMEGPFISPKPGAIGAHPQQHVLDPDPAAFDQFQEWAGGNIKIMTLAPEQSGALKLIRHLVKRGVRVSLGHHLSGDDDLRRAVEAGARLHTHVGNGIPNQIHRHDNPLWWIFACDRLTGMFITDGHHLPADLITVAVRAKGAGRMIITSDASPIAGMPSGQYTIFDGLSVTIDRKGKIYSDVTKSLAGSHATMIECMNHLASLNLLSAQQLWRVGMVNPLRMLGLAPSYLAGLRGPAVTFAGNRFHVRASRH